MKKKYPLIFLLIFVGIALLYLSISIGKKIRLEREAQIIPQFAIYGLDGTKFLPGKASNGNDRIVFCYYNPECEYCIKFSEKLVKYNPKLDSTTFFMVSNAQDSLVNYFIKSNGLNLLKNVHFISDKKYAIYDYFNIKSVPTYFIYKNKKLVSKFSGLFKIETLIQQ